MKERPILFSGKMVEAILAGNKTQTRRVINPQPEMLETVDLVNRVTVKHPGKYVIPQCPYGDAGDRLWVREAIEASDGDGSPIRYSADGFVDFCSNWVWNRLKLPAIYCPRGMSRITLEIVNVRAEKLQDISDEDAKAEGLVSWKSEKESGVVHYGISLSDVWETNPRSTYKRLWDSINGRRHPWDSNPWIWVVEFKRL